MFNFIRRPLKRNFGVDKEYYRFIDDMFGFIPNNIELYKVALIHKSASQSVSGHHINNERLEYLGDAVIESITSDYLFIEYPDRDEGFLTQMRSKIVSRQSLNEVAHKIGLDKYLICYGEVSVPQKHIYGDAFEAMIGAIYLDKGYDFVNRLLINHIFAKYLDLDELCGSERDFKSRLVEWCQKNRHNVVFRTRKGNHSRHEAPVFYTTVLIDNIEVGHGTGDSKKSAEQSAAASASHTFSDEECADILDKFDKLLQESDRRGSKNKQQKSEKSAAPAPAPVPAAENGGETGEASAEGAGEHAEHPEHKRRRRHRRGNRHSAESAEGTTTAAAPNTSAEQEVKPAEEHRTDNDAATVAEPRAEVPAGPAEGEAASAEPAAKPRRRTRTRKSESTEAAAAAATAANNGETAEAEEPKPAKRRGRKPKAEQAAEGGETAANAENTEPKPAKRRGRKPKSESAKAAAETGTNNTPAAEE